MGANSTAGKKVKRAKWRRRIAIAFVVYTLFGFFVLPVIISSQARKQIAAITKRDVTIRQVRVNPFACILTIRGLAIKEPNGEVFASFEEFKINFQPIASIFHWGWVFREISLKDPYGAVVYREDGSFNFANILADMPPPPPTPKKPSQPPKLLVYRLSVTNGALAFSDLKRKEPFHSRFGPVNLNLTNFTTVRNKNSPYSFIALTDSGERFAWAGNVTVNPPSSSGVFHLDGFTIGKYTPYARDMTRFDIASGTVSVGADYRLDLSTNEMELDVTNASVALNNLVLKSPDGSETLISVPSFAMTDCSASLHRRTARVGHMTTSDGSLAVRREKDGTINLLSMLNLPTNSAAKPASTSDAAPFSAQIDDITVDNYSLKIEDKTPEKPANFDIDQIKLKIRDISTESNAQITTALSVRFEQTGSVDIRGSATLIPPSAELQIAISNLDLRPLQPYAHEKANLAITSCAMDVTGTARLSPERLGPPRGTFVGDIVFSKLGTTDDVQYKDLARWDLLTISGIKAEVMPEKLHVDQIKFTGLSGSLIIGPDHRPNVLNILRTNIDNPALASTNGVAPSSNAAPAKKLPDVDIGEIAFENGSIHFIDESLTPRCSFDVQQFGGSIRGLTSKEGSPATIDVKGKVDDRSPFSMSGTVHPLAKQLFMDLSVAVTNTELTAFSTYTEKYAGHPLQKGKFSMSVHYLINDKALKAENSFYVDQLTLGPKNDSPDATALPVKLAIALLKDRNGRISLDVPVTGQIDDPKFRVWPIIGHVLWNLVEKAATSPFALLGAAFGGGGGEELSFVEFAPAHAEVSEGELKKLDTLSKALYDRPELNLEITGSVDPEKEREPLARLRLEERVKSLYVQELTESGKPAVPVSEVQLEPKEHERLVRKIYKKDIGKYKPSEPPTNSVAATAQTNAAPEPESSSSEPVRGSTLLMQKEKPMVVPERLAKAAAASGQPAKTFTRSQIEIADMEDQLVARIEITDDDLRDLMQQRANQVQAALLKTEKVDAARLFIIAPKNIDASFKGAPRANLSLN